MSPAPHSNGSVIKVEDLVVEYTQNGEPLRAVDGVGFTVEPGQRVALVGPSGCGKSSILRAMAGLEKPTSGTITFGELDPLAARERRVFGLVPQHHALLRWRTTANNVGLPLELDKTDRAESERRVAELLELFGLSEFAAFYPGQLSGGMRSRASIARALAVEPEVLLLDECFASLDVMTRERLYKELSPMWSKLGTSLVFITHSVPEAVYLADEVIVLTALPSRVFGRLTINAPQPREADFMSGEEFRRVASKTRSMLGL